VEKLVALGLSPDGKSLDNLQESGEEFKLDISCFSKKSSELPIDTSKPI
jgi:hypothetical protein